MAQALKARLTTKNLGNTGKNVVSVLHLYAFLCFICHRLEGSCHLVSASVKFMGQSQLMFACFAATKELLCENCFPPGSKPPVFKLLKVLITYAVTS